ncbi:tetratricopeptide repeat protein [Bremerella alba]|nr:tetratricopeptide repeat protein [Bremerella alba]
MAKTDASVVLLMVGLVLLVFFRAVFWKVAGPDIPIDAIASGNTLTRILSALVASFGIVGSLAVFVTWPLSSGTKDTLGETPIHWIFAVLLLVLVPAIYESAKGHSNVKTAFDYLSQSRLVEASDLMRHCIVLDAGTSYHGTHFRSLIVKLEARIEAIQKQVYKPLSRVDSIEKQIEQAINLAILNRRDEAILLLLPLVQSPDFAASGGHGLLGTIYQDRRNWEESLFHFRLAAEFWQAQRYSPEHSSGLAKSIQGQAYALRKLGRIDEAAAMYARLLELSPTAEHHFLLAQFHEDIQDTSQAAYHARRAIEISPEHYHKSAGSLINKMKTSHFGCFQLYAD